MIWLMSILGVAVAVGLAAALYGLPQPTLSCEQARRAYLADCFTDHVQGVWLDGRRRVALLALADPTALGLVLALGDKLVTRRLTPSFLRSIEEAEGDLVFRLDDLVLPRVRFRSRGAEAEDGADQEIRNRLARWQKSEKAGSALGSAPEVA